MRRHTGLIATVLLLGGCTPGMSAGTPTTPPTIHRSLPRPIAEVIPASSGVETQATAIPGDTPTSTLAPSVSPRAPQSGQAAPGAAPASWPYTTTWRIRDVLFAPHGEVYVVETWEEDLGDGSYVEPASRIVGLAPDGLPLAGWPWTPAPGAGQIADAHLEADGTLDVLVAGPQGTESPSDDAPSRLTLHRLSSAAVDASPALELPIADQCDIVPAGLEATYVVCDQAVQAIGLPDLRLRWSQSLGLAEGAGILNAQSRPDGALVLVTDTEKGGLRLAVLGPGAVGSPIAWRELAQAWWESTLSVDSRGTVWQRTVKQPYEQCSGPLARTSYSPLNDGGRPEAGWPVTVGWASDPPLVDKDGNLYVTTSSGALHAFSSSGRELPGWPVRHLDVAIGCWRPAPPVSAGADGLVVTGTDHVTLVTRDGLVAPGWPVKVPYPLAIQGLGDTPGPDIPIPPVVGRYGIYLAAYSKPYDYEADSPPRVIGIDRQGTMPKAWQTSFGEAGEEIEQLVMAPSGRVWAATDSGVYLVGIDAPFAARDAFAGAAARSNTPRAIGARIP